MKVIITHPKPDPNPAAPRVPCYSWYSPPTDSTRHPAPCKLQRTFSPAVSVSLAPAPVLRLHLNPHRTHRRAVPLACDSHPCLSHPHSLPLDLPLNLFRMQSQRSVASNDFRLQIVHNSAPPLPPPPLCMAQDVCVHITCMYMYVVYKTLVSTLPSTTPAQAVMYEDTSIVSGNCVIETSKRDWTLSSTLASSSDDANVIASPFVPKRPARPTR